MAFIVKVPDDCDCITTSEFVPLATVATVVFVELQFTVQPGGNPFIAYVFVSPTMHILPVFMEAFGVNDAIETTQLFVG